MNEFSENERLKDKVLQALTQLERGQPLTGGVLSALQSLRLVELGPDKVPRLTEDGQQYLRLGPFAPAPGARPPREV
jgi:hypothetical protein